MRNLNYQLKQLCRRNRDGSYTTQRDREYHLTLIADQLHALGFHHMTVHSLKAKHVDALTRQWLARGLKFRHHQESPGGVALLGGEGRLIAGDCPLE